MFRYSGKLLLIIASTLISIAISLQAEEKELSIGDEGNKIYGTLLTPESESNTILIIHSGSGPTDRDGNTAMLGGSNNSLKMLAESITEKGISTFRYDKRLIGQSQGSMNEADLRFDHYVGDLVNWIKYFKENGYSDIILAGHSEGSLISLVAANRVDVSKVISIAGPGKNASEIIIEQLAKQAPFLVDEVQSKFDSLMKGDIVKEVSPNLYTMLRPSVQPYMISWFHYDPRIEMEKMKVPVLIINGTEDIQVPQDNADLLMTHGRTAEKLIIENMNHVLKVVPAGDMSANQRSYTDPNFNIPDELVNGIIEFIKK